MITQDPTNFIKLISRLCPTRIARGLKHNIFTPKYVFLTIKCLSRYQPLLGLDDLRGWFARWWQHTDMWWWLHIDMWWWLHIDMWWWPWWHDMMTTYWHVMMTTYWHDDFILTLTCDDDHDDMTWWPHTDMWWWPHTDMMTSYWHWHVMMTMMTQRAAGTRARVTWAAPWCWAGRVSASPAGPRGLWSVAGPGCQVSWHEHTMTRDMWSPGVYTQTSHFVEWILETMADN